MAVDKPLTLGPFIKGLNLASDATDVAENECVEALNFDQEPNGSLKSRPPFTLAGASLSNSQITLGATGNARVLGYFYNNNGDVYLIASDGGTKTLYFFGGTWTVITSTFAASAMAQFDGKAYLVAPPGEPDPGGYWTPAGGFVADANMPTGRAIAVYKDRMWIASGAGSSTPTSMFYSKLIVEGTIWATVASREVQVNPGDGQTIVALTPYFGSLLIFRNQSIYSYAYATSTAAATISIVAPGIGLASVDSLAASEAYLYFMFDDKAYEFVNSRAQRINQQVPFRSSNSANIAYPYAVSVLNKRVLFTYFDYHYVFNLDTRTWTRWRSDVWGPIGPLWQPIPGTAPVEAYALPSSAVPEGLIVDTNLEVNPTAQVDTTGWVGAVSSGSGGVATISRRTSVVGMPSGKTTCIRATLTTAGTTTYFGAQTNVSGYEVPVVPGDKVQARMDVRPSANKQVSVRIEWRDSSHAFIGAGTSTLLSPGASVWASMKTIVETAPAGAAYAYVFARIVTSPAVNDFIDVGAVRISKGGDLGYDFWDGASTNTSDYTYGWTGTAGSSTSTRTRLTRKAALLKINEVLNASDKESFTCALQTKNYSYDLPSNFKRMWWWGVDAVFRQDVRGEAHPIVQTQSVTWADLWAGLLTWADMLINTWDAPVGADAIEEVTEYQTDGLGFIRKFVKFRKAMRFRQVYFRVEFTSDGSISTAPVYLFTLRARIAVRQTVSKAIT